MSKSKYAIIQISGAGSYNFFHRINKSTYDYWIKGYKKNQPDLFLALDQGTEYDYKSTNVPADARFNLRFCDLNPSIQVHGFNIEETRITITNDEGSELYSKELQEFISTVEESAAEYMELACSTDEIYPHEISSGFYLCCTQPASGNWFRGKIYLSDEEVLNPEHLLFDNVEFWDDCVNCGISYKGQRIENIINHFDEEMEEGYNYIEYRQPKFSLIDNDGSEGKIDEFDKDIDWPEDGPEKSRKNRHQDVKYFYFDK
jgi:hypothetical protein